MAQQKYRISDKAPHGLYIRRAPNSKDNLNKITVLPMGHLVTKKAESGVPKWWEVSTTHLGAAIEGFVNSDFLVADSTFVPAAASTSVSAVHLSTSQSVTRSNLRYAFPLNEPGQPTRDHGASPDQKKAQLTAIINWLDVERKVRYQPKSGDTYCNIYAYDYCYLAGVFLPRVWWYPSAIDSLKKGKSVSPVYGSTVHEINANGLYEWLRTYGPTFGWEYNTNFNELQNAANSGQVVIISGAHKKPNRSGHITAVVPETASQKATRSGSTVTHPLQSQAGATNNKYLIRAWWTLPYFRAWGYWINRT